MSETWIQTDEAADVAGSLRHALRALSFVSEDPQAWKWVMIALHSALQGACVCHLTTTAVPLGAVTEKNARKWSAYYEESRTNPNGEPPKTYLMRLPDLLEAVRKPNAAGGGGELPGIEIIESEMRWLRRFHDEFRNHFVHFAPLGWSIEVSGIPDLAKLVARIISEILTYGWAFRHLEPAEREDMAQSLSELQNMTWPV